MVDRSENQEVQDGVSAVNALLSTHATESTGMAKGIRLGSLFVSYVESYAEAWQKLLPANQKLALPILYLQRHTFELLTKDILSAILDIREGHHTLDALLGTLLGAGPVDPADFDIAHSTHVFSELFPSLRRNLASLGLPPLPQVFDEVRRLFDEVDEERPDRLRYATLFSCVFRNHLSACSETT